MKILFIFFILTITFAVFPKTVESAQFETNITNLNNEEDVEIMRMKSVACLYMLNLKYDYNKEVIENTLKSSPQEDKSKIVFNINNDKTLHEANLYDLIEAGAKEDEFLMDADLELDLDEEELAIQKFIMSDVEFPKDQLIKEQQPEMISKEEQKQRAEEAFQKQMDKMNEEEQNKKESKNKQQEKPKEETNEILEKIKYEIQQIMQNENFTIYLGLALGLVTMFICKNLIYFCFILCQDMMTQKKNNSVETQKAKEEKEQNKTKKPEPTKKTQEKLEKKENQKLKQKKKKD